MKIYEPEQKKTIQVSWLSSAVYEEGKGYVSLRFDPHLKPYLLQLKSHFTKVNTAEAFELKSVHALRIYELLTQYSKIGKRDISVDDLREYCGIKKSEYLMYADLKRKVIERAKNEINEKTHYEIDYTESKRSRKVEKIHWTIDKKNQLKEFAAKSQPILKNSIEISHKIKEIADFVKVYENEVSGVHYLLNAIDLKTKGDTLIITFDDKFSKSQCEQNITLQHRLNLFFQTKHVEIF